MAGDHLAAVRLPGHVRRARLPPPRRPPPGTTGLTHSAWYSGTVQGRVVPADIEQVVKCAATHGLQVAAQAGGHGATRALDGTIVVRTDALDELSVDATARTAQVGAGVRWGALQRALDGTGLTGLPGSSANVSVVGYCLNGGFSWFSRPYGSGAGSLRAVELIDGRRRASRCGRTSFTTQQRPVCPRLCVGSRSAWST
ncbi:FAD-binding oxidoreductase [Kribbella sp.]|uniref:FAD-binding oxidoreductase n=1 Tax=Kribbella sp. TaxID=1871183 RepID=UPI0039C9B2F7